jgi:hypothetical protein
MEHYQGSVFAQVDIQLNTSRAAIDSRLKGS